MAKKSLTGFMEWLLTTPEAYSILLMTSAIVTALLFTTLLVLSLIFGWAGLFKLIFGLFSAISIYKLYTTIKAKRIVGSGNLVDSTLAELMNYEVIHEDGDEQSERFCPEQGNDNDGESIEGFHKDVTKRVSSGETEPEPDNISFSDIIQESSSIVKEHEFDHEKLR